MEKEKESEYPKATLESVWAAFREADFQRKKAEERFEREMTELRAEEVKRKAETNKESAILRKEIRELNITVNGICKSDGLYAEEYFTNSFKRRKRTFFGETFDDMKKNLKGMESTDEYDIVLLNGKSVGIVEVKYRGRLDHISKILNKANSFRANFPKYQNHRIYIALASMMFHQRLEDECKKNGIAIVKQVGETVVINDAHLIAY